MKIVLWGLYVVVALFSVLLSLLTAGHWFSLALALAFIFGPKFWREL